MIGPRPIDTVGNSQKSGISHGCGYDDRPPPGVSSRRKFSSCVASMPPFEERARVDAGRGVALEVDDVAVVVVALAAEEVVEADLVERRGRGVGRDVAADALFGLVRAHHHGQRVPADEALDAALDLAAARERRLLVGGNRVDVGRVGGERKLDAALPRVDRSSSRSRRPTLAGPPAAAHNRATRATRGFRWRRARPHPSAP